MKNRLHAFVFAAASAATSVAPAQTGSAPPPAVGSASFTPAQLDTLAAPIALYPDALILQVVQCASSPYQVNQVNEWLKQNAGLRGTAVQDAASAQGFDASFVAIVLFPDVVKMMAEKPEWTRQLGQAFTTDKDALFASIQRLRSQAQAAGNLKTTEQQHVQTVAGDNGQQVIVIQPANPQVVYVPTYNPQVVYTQPAAGSSSNSGEVAAAGLIGFAAGVIVAAAADDDDDHYYYAYGGWGYSRPVCYPGGWDDYYDHRENMAKDYYNHRENMANDYYDHRESMAGQREENQGQRQQTGTTNQTNRQEAASGNQAARQESRAQAQSAAGTNQAARQNAAGSQQATAAAATRGSFQAGSRTSDRSDALSGYQRGSTERASSARGQSSLNRSGARSGGGGRGGGGRGR